MLHRVINSSNPGFRWTGARGIFVCRRWRDGDGERGGFECFLADLGPKPPGAHLDRIDKAGHFEPGNVRWTCERRAPPRPPRYKLTDHDIAEIRRLAGSMRPVDIAKRFGVTGSHVCNIVAGRTRRI